VYIVGVSKKTEKPKKSNREKNRLELKKKPIGSVWFWFHKAEIGKPEPNPNRKKTEPS